MSNTMFQAAVGGFPNVGAGFHGIQPRRGFAGLADVSSDDAIIMAARVALGRADQNPQLMATAPPAGGWTTANPGLANSYYNLSNQMAAGRAEGWGASYADEIRQRTATLLSYLPGDTAPAVVTSPVITPTIEPIVGGNVTPVPGVLPAPAGTPGTGALDGTIALPVVGSISKKTALLVAVGVGAYFFLGK